jgi:hypothetical protein
MAMHSGDHLQTMAYAYQEICQGEEPWVALGNFMNAWFGYAQDRRWQLIEEPPRQPKDATLSQRRWSAFIAASVEWLCSRYHVPCPQWVDDPCYTLPKPWFDPPATKQSHLRTRLIQETPEPFTRRRIYCGNRLYNNKYELADLAAQLKALRAKKALTTS